MSISPEMKAMVDNEVDKEVEARLKERDERLKKAAHERTAILADFLERAGWSAGEQFLAVLFTTSTAVTLAGLPWAAASVMAVGAAIISILTTTVEYASKPVKQANYWAELALRLVKTFASSLLGAMTAEAVFNFLNFGWIAALNLAAVATIAALGKGLLARNSTGTPNASTLPYKTYELARGKVQGDAA